MRTRPNILRFQSALRLEVLEARTLPALIQPLFNEVKIPTATDTHINVSSNPDAGATEDGRTMVAWNRQRTTTNSDVQIKRYDAQGKLLPVNGTISVGGTVENESQGRIAVRREGSFVVVYSAPSLSGNISVFAKIYDINGNQVAGGTKGIQVATVGYGARNQFDADVALQDATGSFVVTWTDNSPVTGLDVRFRIFNAVGNAITGDLQVATLNGTESQSAVTYRPGPGAGTAIVITYTRLLQGASTTDVVFNRFDGAGNSLDPSPVKVNTVVNRTAFEPAIAIDAALNFVVTYTNLTGVGNIEQIKFRRFDGNGTPATLNDEVVSLSSFRQFLPDVAKASDTGVFVVTFTDTLTTPQRTVFQQYTAAGVKEGGRRFVTSHQSAQDHVTVGASHNGYFAFALDDAFTAVIEPWFRTFLSPLVPPSPGPYFAIGGAPGRVQVRRQADGWLVGTFAPYANYANAVSVTLGDVTGDGIADLITGALVGNPHVRIFNGAAFANGTFDLTNPTASLVAEWFPYELQFNVGANVAAGDVNNDGFGDVITGASVGNPDVIVFDGKDIAMGTFDPAGGSQLAHFFAYGLNFNIGANVAAGDVDNDGFADLITGPTAGNPDIHVYRGLDIALGVFNPTGASLIAQWFAYGINFNVGAFLSAADMNGDGFQDVVTGASTGNPQVNVYSGITIANGTFDPNGSLLAAFFAFDVGQGIGVSVGASDPSGTGFGEILTGSTRTSQYRLVAGLSAGVKPPVLRGIDGFANDVVGGIFVGT